MARLRIDGWAGHVAAGLLVAVFVARGVHSARQKSPTWDEVAFFGIGVHLIETGRWDVRGAILHPPLSFVLHGLPLLGVDAVGAAFEPLAADEQTLENLGAVDLGRSRALLALPENRGDALLAHARGVALGVGALGALLVHAFARALYGASAGLLALFLYTMSPNVLAHARLITSDGVVATFCLAAVFAAWRALRSGRRREALLAGGALGLALLSKFTALLLLPVIGALFALEALRSGRPRWAQAAALLGVGAAVLLAGYRLDPSPFFQGIGYQLEHSGAGTPAFLMGEHSRDGWWYFMPLAFALKTTLPALALIGWGAWLAARRRPAVSRLEEGAVVLAPLAFFGLFALFPKSIGLRYVLPALPFLFVLASRVAATAGRTRAGRLALALLVTGHAAASLAIHPHYLAYFNELAGGPSRGWRVLVDSNLDWGQDLPGLAAFQRERGIARIQLSYFGADDPARYGIRYEPLPSFLLPEVPGPPPGEPPSPWLAISATNLQGVYLAERDRFAAFREREPVAAIGHTIFVYRLP